MLHSPKIGPTPLIGGVTPQGGQYKEFSSTSEDTLYEHRKPILREVKSANSRRVLNASPAQAQTAIIQIRFRETQDKILPDATDVECCSKTLAEAEQVLLGNRNGKGYLIPTTETGADTEGASRTFLDINLKVHRIGAVVFFSR